MGVVCAAGVGERPEPKYAFEVLGAIIETPMGGAYDTLAAYADDTARSSTIPASGGAKPRTNLSCRRRGYKSRC